MSSPIRRRLATASLVVLVAASCDTGNGHEINAGRHERPSTTTAPATTAPRTSSTAPNAGEAPFALGVEYTERGLGELYGSAGITWAKTRLEAFEWGRAEPTPPSGGIHNYDWSCTDALVGEYQHAGITNLQSYLSTVSSWGDEPSRVPMPSPQHLDDYRAWVRALIERYDGDGTDDMADLVAPVRFWVVGGEWTGFWRSGNADDYVTTLRATREAARSAYADVQLGAIPFLLIDVFSGDPSGAEIDRRLAAPARTGRKSTPGMLQILGHPELFDYVDFHSLGDYTEIRPTLSWLREQMSAKGYAKPIWIDDAFPMSLLANVAWPTFYPVTDANKAAVLQVIADAAERKSADATSWIRAQAASGTVKKAVTALGEGARGINIGNTEDWVHDTVPGLRRINTNLLGAAGLVGMADVRHDRGFNACDVRTAGAPRPALRAMELVHQELRGGGFEATRMREASGVRGYRLERAEKVLWVLWHDDGTLHLPGDAEPPVSFALDVPAGIRTVKVTTTPTAEATTSPVVERKAVQEGHVDLSLTSVPVFVDGA